ncbi:hypothetical protein [Alteromonas gracilis]|uniref:hypothetical protein n=1 Tax=Alteromonas gracilis TaxID=1479524 RepID=UPI0030D03221
MLKETTKLPRLSVTRALVLSIIVFSLSTLSYANDIRINGSVSVEGIYRDSDSNNSRFDETVGQVAPTFGISYQSARVSARLNARATHLERDNSDALNTQRNTFGSYNYNSRVELLENLLFLTADGGFSYRDGNPLNFLTSDFVNNSDNLVKTRTNSLAANVVTQNNRRFLVNGVARFSRTETDNTQRNEGRIEDNNYSLTGSIQSNSLRSNVIWDARGSYIETERGGANQNSLMTRNYLANAEIKVFDNFGAFVTTSHDAFQNESQDGNVNVQQFYSYGAGITYRQNRQRFLRLAFNKQFDSNIDVELADDQDINDDDYFLSGELNWAISQRSSIRGLYTRRSTGRTGQLALNYNTRRIRARVDYNDSVTSFSRLISSPENLGVFVCQQGSSDIADCFQPASLDYTLDADEQFVNFLSPNFEVSNEVINRESLIAQIGLQGRLTNISFNTRYSLDSFIDSGRQTRTISVGSTLSHNIGVRSRVSLSATYARIQNNLSDTVGLDSENDNINASLVFTHSFRSPLTANLGMYYIERDAGGSINQNFGLQERRLQLTIRYTFFNRNGARNQGGNNQNNGTPNVGNQNVGGF